MNSNNSDRKRVRGVQMPQPTLSLRFKEDYGDAGAYKYFYVTIKGANRAVRAKGIHIKLVLWVPSALEDVSSEWIQERHWEWYATKEDFVIAPHSVQELEELIQLPEDAVPSHDDYRHTLAVILDTDSPLQPGAEAEIIVLREIPEFDTDQEVPMKDIGYTKQEDRISYGDNRFRPHELEDYWDRFCAMAADLQSVADVVVLNFHVFPPMNEAELKQAEEALGYSLPEDLLAIYRHTNGLQLRWIAKDNPEYDPVLDVPATNSLPWDWEPGPRREDGVVFIPPLTQLLAAGNLSNVVDDPTDRYRQLYFGERIPMAEFRSSLRVFDRFSESQQALLCLRQGALGTLLIGNLMDRRFELTFYIDIGTYLEFLIARLGLVQYREIFLLKKLQSKRVKFYYGGRKYWEWQSLDAKLLGLKAAFPQCMVPARPSEMNAQRIAEKIACLSRKHIEIHRRGIEAHRVWVEAGGRVKGIGLFAVQGRPWLWGFSVGNTEGHFVENLGRLPGESWRGQNLPFMVFAALDARGLDAAEANLSFGAYIHGNFEGANFAGAKLCGVDFTGSNLRHANFQGADIAGADFEICDLRDADFTGANTQLARFPGAKLRGVKLDTPDPVAPTVPVYPMLLELLRYFSAARVDYLFVEQDADTDALHVIFQPDEHNVDHGLTLLGKHPFMKVELPYLSSEKLKKIAELPTGQVWTHANLVVHGGDYEALAAKAKWVEVAGIRYRSVRMEG
jgi:hypothetical protein